INHTYDILIIRVEFGMLLLAIRSVSFWGVLGLDLLHKRNSFFCFIFFFVFKYITLYFMYLFVFLFLIVYYNIFIFIYFFFLILYYILININPLKYYTFLKSI